MTDLLNSSDVKFGDIVINSCDSAWDGSNNQDAKSINERIYGVAAYALFANRIIIPSRYLLYGGLTYEAVAILRPLLEAGLLVPDLQEGYWSFSNFIKDQPGMDDNTRK